MGGAVIVPGRPARRRRPGPWIRGGGLDVGRGLALSGLGLAALGLLLIVVATVLLTGLGIIDLLTGNWDQNHGRGLLALLAGLVIGRFLLPAALLGIRRLAMTARRLSGAWCGVPIADGYQPPPATDGAKLRFTRRLWWLLADPATWRDLLWTTVNSLVGWIMTLVPPGLVAVGLIGFLAPAFRAFTNVPPPAFPGNSPPVLVFLAMVFVVTGLWTAPWLLRAHGGLARSMLAADGQAELERRVQHLAQTRSETIDSGAAEIRRIERDLHDGAQARLVAMGMALGAAEELLDSSPAAARALLLEARESSAKALAELRALVRGIHPPVLADRGLADAVRALALDSGLKVDVSADLPGRPEPPVESAAYFAVCELLANVTKHACARQAWIDMRHERGLLRVDVSDDGHGGADPGRGTGLRGIERRLAAFDGILALNSPPGGPTVATMEIPCALSSPKTSSC
jgi:signal transduction histidine kinase